MTEENSVESCPPSRWRWSCVPLAFLACAANTTAAVSEMFGNFAYALGMHISYQREQENQQVPAGTIFRED